MTLNTEVENRTMEYYINYFDELFTPSKPLAKMFRTEEDGYLYDNGTNNIFRCDEDIFLLLNNMYSMPVQEAFRKTISEIDGENTLKAAKTLFATQKENNLLLNKPENIIFHGGHFENLEYHISHKLQQLILEVTERCNLRCKYCIYNEGVKDVRNHSNNDMTEEIAFKAVDYLYDNSDEVEEPTISFYGGEPLLEFDLIKQVVEYSKDKFKNRKISFAMTTNCTLITEEISEFLAVNLFYITLSIDGPKEIHNMYRTTNKNLGSFEKVIDGINNLNKAFTKINADKKFNINIVYSPPYTLNKLNDIFVFFNESTLFSKVASFNISYPHKGSIPQQIIDQYSTKEEKNLYKWTSNNFVEYLTNNHDIPLFYKRQVEQELVHIFTRKVSDIPNNKIFLNGCCIPFGRKIFISSKGEINICERADGTPGIGNIKNEININIIKEYFVDVYSKESFTNCSKCWGNKICGLCYAYAYETGYISIKKRNKYCNTHLENILSNLELYSKLLKINADSLNYLSEYEIM
jgi:uncharacterized protein